MADIQMAFLISESLKKSYQKWCVDQGIPMSEPLRLFVEWITERHIDYEDIQSMLDALGISIDDDTSIPKLATQGQGE